MTLPFQFELPHPHVIDIAVNEADIDAYQHVNNSVYVVWCDQTAWSHSAALGLPIERCLELDRGMAVIRTLIKYERPALLGDVLQAATWILPTTSRLCVKRRFQIVRPGDGATLARAEVEYACIELSSGRPMRWPPEFKRYATQRDVVAALATLPPI